MFAYRGQIREQHIQSGAAGDAKLSPNPSIIAGSRRESQSPPFKSYREYSSGSSVLPMELTAPDYPA